jgi:hypothetical protein
MLKPSTNPDGTPNLIVDFESGKLSGATPATRDQFLDLFKFDPCYNKLVEKNPVVFSSTSVRNTKGD